MSLELAKAFVRVRADASRVPGDLKRARPGITSAVSSIGAKLGAGLAAAFGLAVLKSVTQESIALAQTQIDAEARLAAAIKATAGAAGFSAAQLKVFASDLQSITTFGDEAILEAGAKLLTFKAIQGDVFKRTLKAAMDLSATGFGGLRETVLQLGKAIEDPTKGMSALTRVGVTFSEVQKENIRNLQKEGKLRAAQVVLLKTVEGQVKGVAEALAKTPAGKLQQANNALGDMKEVLGKALIPMQTQFVALTQSLVKGMIIVTRAFTDNKRIIIAVGTAIGLAATALLTYLAAVKAVTAAQIFFMALGGPVAWAAIAAGVVAGTVAVVALNKAWKETADAAEKTADEITKVGNSITLAKKKFGRGFAPGREFETFSIAGQKKQIEDATKSMFEMREAIFSVKSGASDVQIEIGKWMGANQMLTDRMRGQWQKVREELERVTDAQKEMTQAAEEARKAAVAAVQKNAQDARAQMDAGEALKRSVQTPKEILRGKMFEIENLFRKGLIDRETRTRATAKAKAAAFVAPDKQEARFADISRMGRVMQEALFKGQKRDIQKDMLEEQKKLNKIELDILKEFQGLNNGGLVAGNN